MPVIFHEQEKGYDAWIKRHPYGYVFDFLGGKNPCYNKIHHVNCWKNKGEGVGRHRTIVKKVCCENLEDLKAYANVLRGGEEGWTFCKTCFPVKKLIKPVGTKKKKRKYRKVL
jgi:hypothetical protein